MFSDTLTNTATTLVKYCQTGQERKGLDELYAPHCTSAEALSMGGEIPRVVEGLDAIRAKHDWWEANNEVHSTTAEGPFLHGEDQFSVIFGMDVTDKATGTRTQMQEVGHYTVDSDGKIVSEAFYYPPMG